MWDKHWERVDSFLKKWEMVQEGDSILLGISGGADSVCLARYFLARREALSLKLYAVHINHMLRGEEVEAAYGIQTVVMPENGYNNAIGRASIKRELITGVLFMAAIWVMSFS